MTTFAEPIVAIATAEHSTEPTAPASRLPGPPSGHGWPGEVPLSTEQLLCHRDQLQAGHPDRATLRASVIEMNLSLANNLARRYAGRGEQLDDLAQVAAVALIKAVDGYDSGRQVPFAGYAVPCILGALKRHFRDAAWAVRVPRSTQELARQLPTATAHLGHQRGRTPTTAELAVHLRVSSDRLATAIGAKQNYRLASLTAPPAAADGADLIGDHDPGYARVDDQVSVRSLVAALPLRERRILVMRFYEHMSQAQIAAEIGVSQMHVSRLLRQALAQLRAALPD